MSAAAPTLFDIDPHGTPCMVCLEVACTCRVSGALEAAAPAPFVTGDSPTARAEVAPLALEELEPLALLEEPARQAPARQVWAHTLECVECGATLSAMTEAHPHGITCPTCTHFGQDEAGRVTITTPPTVAARRWLPAHEVRDCAAMRRLNGGRY